MPLPKYGEQLAKALLREAGYSVHEATLWLREHVRKDVNETHVRNALNGRTVPHEHVKTGIARLLDRPVEQCWSAEVLNSRFGKHGPRHQNFDRGDAIIGYVENLVAAAPEFTAEQRERLARLLKGTAA